MFSVNKLLILLYLVYPVYSKNIYSVIIIGAGPSGIAAATKLLQNNVSDIRIFEAEPRIGGRVNSVKFGDAYVDLGAEWCHGEKDNIVYKLAKEYDILTSNNSTDDFWYSSNGIMDDDVKRDIKKIADYFIYNYGDVVDKEHKHLSLGEYFLNLYNETIIRKYRNDTAKLKIVMEAIDWFEHFVLSMDCAFSWNDVTVDSEYTYCEGNQNLNWNGMGYKTILEILMKKYPDTIQALPIDDKIVLNKEVTKIIWKHLPDQQVMVNCMDGTSYKAEYVIFTPSVGVLRAKHHKLFTPALSKEKVTAIENIGLGAIVKVPLHFPTTWWKPTDTAFSLFWSTEDKQKLLKEFPQGHTKNGNSWLTGLTYLYQAENNPNVWISWFTGKMVPEIEKLSDNDILNGCMFAIRHFLGKFYNISQPDAMIRSYWYSNPHFHGSWSYETVKGISLGVKLQDALAKPLKNNGKPQVLFAGEATHPIYFSTVHGAIEAGYREADRIINLVK